MVTHRFEIAPKIARNRDGQFLIQTNRHFKKPRPIPLKLHKKSNPTQPSNLQQRNLQLNNHNVLKQPNGPKPAKNTITHTIPKL